MHSTGLASAQSARLDALCARHAALAEKIEQEQSRVTASDWYVRDLKKQKLRLKEEIEEIKEAC